MPSASHLVGLITPAFGQHNTDRHVFPPGQFRLSLILLVASIVLVAAAVVAVGQVAADATGQGMTGSGAEFAEADAEPVDPLVSRKIARLSGNVLNVEHGRDPMVPLLIPGVTTRSGEDGTNSRYYRPAFEEVGIAS